MSISTHHNKIASLLLFWGVLLLISNKLNAQYFIYSEQKPDISTRFIRSNIEAQAKDVVFNALWIKNKANRPENITLNISVPQGWNVIGPDNIELSLGPLDSTVVPIRIGVGAKIKGNIGYSVIASLVDSRGNTIKNEYCFIKIPNQFDLKYKIIGGLSYLDPVNRTSSFSVLVQNRGNREETVSFLLDGNRILHIGPDAENIFSQDYVVQPYSDTTITFYVELTKDDTYNKNMFPLQTDISSTDTTISTIIWFRNLESGLVNQINSSEKPLSVELNIQGLMNEGSRPTFSATIMGKTLLNGDNDIYYYYRNYASETTEDLYNKARLHLGANIGRWNIEVGDNMRNMEGNMYGRGFYGAYKSNKVQFSVLANKNINTDLMNFGGQSSLKFGKTTLIVGANYNQQSSTNFESVMGYLGSNFTLNKVHRVYALAAFNQVNKLIDGKQKHTEFGGELHYSSRLGKTSNHLRLEYHSPRFYSYKAGRTNLYSTSLWNMNNRNKLLFILNEYESIMETMNDTIISNTTETRNGEFMAEHQNQVTKEVNVFWGPKVRRLSYKTDNSQYISGRTIFRSLNYGLTVGARVMVNNSLYIVPSFETAITQVIDNPYPSDTLSNSSIYKLTNYQYFSLNIRGNKFGLIASFNTGQRSVNEQMYYARSQTKAKRLMFIPTYNTYIYKDVVNLNLTMSYNNDLISKFSYSSFSAQVECNLPRNWHLRALAQYNTQKRTRSTENFEIYQTFYAEVSIRKEFDIQHPRVKYHDVELLFFKDFNGNYAKEENEPGINNVLVEINRISSDVKGNIPNDLSTAELLSNNLGKVRFENIPEGVYKISYNPLGNEAGNYSKGSEDVQLVIDKSGEFFFPFVEKNKVFGKILLNRSKLSGLGKVDISNIRITTTDSRGNMFSTLTDKNGEFVIYAPSTDEYVVNVNNIFYENFDLRQNNFRVQFNGYKQFEVNFVFDEKVRRINFAQTPTNLGSDDGIIQIRRTNLRGTIKDENSLKPLRARVNLVNTNNNSVVSSVYSNPQTGDYSLAFVSGDNYVLEVLTEDYWYHSENLVLNQVTTFMNVTKDVLLRQITIGSKLELNARFDINSTILLPETVAELNRLMRVLRANPGIKVEIQGFADDVEQIDNPSISEERAKAIAKYIVEHGFSNVEPKGMGNTSPVAPNDTEENRMQNRRVEVVVLGK